MSGIKRIIQVDVDTNRTPTTIIKTIDAVPPSNTSIPNEYNMKADLLVLAEGLIAAILFAESSGVYEKGMGMKKAIKQIEDGYIDATTKLSETREEDES